MEFSKNPPDLPIKSQLKARLQRFILEYCDVDSGTVKLTITQQILQEGKIFVGDKE